MSKGPGRVQRAIEKLMADNPDGAWSTEELCALIYPGANRIEKKHRNAVIRAIKAMTLPDEWVFTNIGARGFEYVLMARYSDEAAIKYRYMEDVARRHKSGFCKYPPPSFSDWRNSKYEQRCIKEAIDLAAGRRKWRDASPAERIDMDIAHIRQMMALMGLAAEHGNREAGIKALHEYAAQIEELKRKKTLLLASPEHS